MNVRVIASLWLLFPIVTSDVARAEESSYLRHVKPLLTAKCYACHGALKQQGGLRLDTSESLHRGGENGSPVVAGEPDESLLIQVVTGSAGFLMPPASDGAPLKAEEIDVLRRWIADGADGPEKEVPQSDPRQWWSYQPIARPELPAIQAPNKGIAPIDIFLTAQKETLGLSTVAAADKATWLRRVTLDLTGLPPARHELQAFLSDDSETAFETVVDELLDRPQYGERWGRHWMDIWRYSDWYGSRGINEIRYSQRHIWRWRDWIIDSLNADKGYDQMIREMLAADEIAADDLSALPATGYLGRNWYKFDRNVWMFDTVERTAEAFLGLTLRCARCHDHKFDPVTHDDYYRFRAFFEPYNVRTDPLSALTGTAKDATLGQVLLDGVARVYDKDLDVKTYRFERGDSRYPDESRVMMPGVPASLSGSIEFPVSPVALPVAGYYPALNATVRDSFIARADQSLETARVALLESETQEAQTRERLKAARSSIVKSDDDEDAAVFLADDFSTAKPDVWQTLNGDWSYENGRLIEKSVATFATIVTKQNHPRDFTASLKYRTLQPGSYRSVGFSFDFIDTGNSQDIYTSTGESRQSVQAFHRLKGQQVYPPAGIVPVTLKVGDEVTLDVVVRGSQLTIDLNGEKKLDYVMPVPRRDGRFALWVHSGAAEFLKLEIKGQTESIDRLLQKQRGATHAVQLARLIVAEKEAEVVAVKARLEAEIATHSIGDDDHSARTAALAQDASRAEKRVEVLKTQQEMAKVEFQIATLIDGQKQDVKPESVGKLESQLAELRSKLSVSEAAVEKPDGKYTPLGEQYSRTSTGRRSALAEWIVSSGNPRTARVAVNHIWGRHFGRPIVDTTENFGLNGRKPSHPELLDWLAAELIASKWKMKSLHRLIVLSDVYRLSSQSSAGISEVDSVKNVSVDPENRYYWRANARRMEAEVVRDSVLFLGGQLDLTRGGPEIPETDGEKTPRRSLYFRNTPNEKMPMLEIFDVANPNSCYRRKESVIPQQALALMNSGLSQDRARHIARELQKAITNAPDGVPEGSSADREFLKAAFETILVRPPGEEESQRCVEFLSKHSSILAGGDTARFTGAGTSLSSPSSDLQTRGRENLIHVLLLHNDFVTIR